MFFQSVNYLLTLCERKECVRSNRIYFIIFILIWSYFKRSEIIGCSDDVIVFRSWPGIENLTVRLGNWSGKILFVLESRRSRSLCLERLKISLRIAVENIFVSVEKI